MLKLAVHKMVDPTGYAPVSQQCQCRILLMDEGSVLVSLEGFEPPSSWFEAR